MTIEITGAPETPASDPPDALQQDGVRRRTRLVTRRFRSPRQRRPSALWQHWVCDGRTVGGCATEPDLSWPRRRNHTRSDVLTNPAWRFRTTRKWHARWSECESFRGCVDGRTGAGDGDRCAPSKRRLERRPRRSHTPRR